MQFTLLNFLSAQVLIQNILCYIQTFWSQSEFSMNINNPFQQECSWCVSKFGLDLGNIIVIKHACFFLTSHIFVAALLEFRNILWIIKFYLIADWHIFLWFSSVFSHSISHYLLYLGFMITFFNWFFILIRWFYHYFLVFLCCFSIVDFCYFVVLSLRH